MIQNRIQDLASFRFPQNFSGKPGWYAQIWWFVQATLFSWSFDFMYGWRSFLLSLFGAKLGKNIRVRPSARITCPWKVTIGDYCWIGQETILHGPGEIEIGNDTVVSARSYIDTASHHYDSLTFDIFVTKVHLDDEVWIATDVFVAAGVTIGKGAVVGARSSVFNDLPAMMVCVGTPAKPVRERNARQNSKPC
jgi:putative colanic acid biosynthesis acetyltransferase WcaF